MRLAGRGGGLGHYHSSPCDQLGSTDQIFTPDDILAGRMPEGRVLLFDDDHYYMGSVLAEALVASGATVCLVTTENLACAWGVNSDEQYDTQQHLLELGVEIVTAHGLDAYDGSIARVSCVYTERHRELSADAIILVTARNPVDELYHQILAQIESTAADSRPSLDKIGDCDAPAIIAAAVYAGHRYARELDVDEDKRYAVRHDRLFDATAD